MRYLDNPEIKKKYNCKKWEKVRNLKIAQCNGLCERCYAKGIYKEGVIVHHKEHVTEENYQDDLVMYNLDNLEFVCANCHLELHQNAQEFYFDKEGNVCSAKRI